MANYVTNLKTWGSTGSEFPDGYSYLEGDQPVDAWDNYFNYNTIEDIQHLVDLTNKRVESGKGASHPTSPEVGHISHRTDSPDAGSGEQTFVYDGGASKFRRLMKADGDTLSGSLDVGGYSLLDSSGTLSIAGPAEVNGAEMDHSWFSKQEGGTVSTGSFTPIGTFGLAAGETLKITQAMLTKDGFTTPADSGIDLLIADENDEADPANATPVSVLSGDGLTLFDNEEGVPVASYKNSTTGHLTVAIGLDNGYFGAGTGANAEAFGGYIARKE